MSFVLASTTGDRRFALHAGETLVAGREIACTIPILDPSVSRRHVEICVDDHGMTLTDLSSRNGTWVNGVRVTAARAVRGDLIAFGTVMFSLLVEEDAAHLTGPPIAALDGATTLVRERAVPSRAAAIEAVAGERLAKLVTLAQQLGGLASVEELLPIVVDTLFGAFPADRVAIMLRGEHGTLDLRIARDTHGSDVTRAVPRAIVNGVAERQTALLTHDAREDTRTAGASVVAQAVRSAMAAPLIGDGHLTLGVLYVDSQRDANAFDENDLSFLVAFAGIAAAAVEREAAATRLRRATHVRENFERYFTPQLAARIAASTDTMALGGHRQRVVVLFSDIRGFTAVAESLPPMEMATQLNEYFGAMVGCVFAHDGALDKFIGDALLAYWGAPEPHADDASHAVRAAQTMRTALAVLNERWHREGRPELHAGMAIHAGEVFLGNIGSPQRLEYTLIGDTVNLTSKLCAQALGDELLITDAVRDQLSGQVVTIARPDIVPVRRSGDATRVWAIPT